MRNVVNMPENRIARRRAYGKVAGSARRWRLRRGGRNEYNQAHEAPQTGSFVPQLRTRCCENAEGDVMRVSDALVVGAIMARPAWTSFEETIAGLVDRLVSAGQLPQTLAARAVQRIAEREAVASTAMVDIGVSIPHARLDGITGIVAALAVSSQAVYEVANDLPISIVALVLSSPGLTGEHLNFLSALSLLLQSARVRDQLRNAASPEAVLQLVRSSEQAP
jgi:nitrogen PTS system EIIA component